MNRPGVDGVEPGMKPAYVLLLGLVVLVATTAPPSVKRPSSPKGSLESGKDLEEAHRAAETMTSFVSDLQGVGSRNVAGAHQSVGNMRIEVDRLKRAGQNLRPIEYYLSDLENSLRRGEPGAAASRHAAHNLDLEIELLKRKLRR